jgi:hypothetical protein
MRLPPPRTPLLSLSMGLALAAVSACAIGPGAASTTRPDWRAARHIATVDERYLSFNVEMVEVTGGRFWAPYGAPAGELYAYRPPLDLASGRLRNLTRALAPAYMRVSGTWANSTYFDDSPTPAPQPPAGFGSVLTGAQWDGVQHFAGDLDLKVVTSFAVGAGTRDANGAWTPDLARRWLQYNKTRGYPIAAAEFYNEATLSAIGGLPKNYSAADFARDLATFERLRAQEMPQLQLLGPSAVGEGQQGSAIPFPVSPGTEAMLIASGPVFDAFSYHFYPALSQRCKFATLGQTSLDAALTDSFLRSAAVNTDFYAHLRDRLLPGAPLWLTETGGAACGGNPWNAAFVDTFRFVEQLGDLARRGVRVYMHNTLVASDYALIDEHDFTPRPSYWAAVLWQRTMGERVLDIPLVNPPENIDIYAHCQRNRNDGAATVLLINRDARREHSVDLGQAYRRYTLTATGLTDTVVQLNGEALAVDAQGNLPELRAIAGSGSIALPPHSISFVAIDRAAVPACR